MGIAPLHITALSLICSVLAGSIMFRMLTPWVLQLGARLRAATAEIPTGTLALEQTSL